MTTPKPAALDVEQLEAALDRQQRMRSGDGMAYSPYSDKAFNQMAKDWNLTDQAARLHLATLKAPCAERTDPMTPLSERILGLKQTAPDNASKADKQYIWGVNSGLESAAAIVGEDWSWLEGMKKPKTKWNDGFIEQCVKKGWNAAIQAVIERVKG